MALVEVRHRLPPLRTLTAIRFFAAIYVVLYHQRHELQPAPSSLILRFLDSGYTGVTLFFVLSGFILAYNYPRITSIRDFWIARFARLYPAYLLSLILMLGIVAHTAARKPHFALGTLLSFALLQAWIPSLAFTLNTPGWTLSVELLFYVSFPLLLPWMQRIRWRTFLGLQIAYLLLLALPPLLALSPHTLSQGMRFGAFLESTFPLVRLNSFVLGIYTGLLFTRRFVRGDSVAVDNQSTSLIRFLLLVPAIAGPAVLLLWAPSVLWAPLRTGLLELCFALFLWQLALVNWRIFTNHVAQVAGEISYGIYILQAPVRLIYIAVKDRLAPHVGYSVSLDVLFLLIASYCSFRWIETPARLWIRRTLTRHRVPIRPV